MNKNNKSTSEYDLVVVRLGECAAVEVTDEKCI